MTYKPTHYRKLLPLLLPLLLLATFFYTTTTHAQPPPPNPFILPGGATCAAAAATPITINENFTVYTATNQTTCGANNYDDNLCTTTGDDGQDYIYVLHVSQVGRYTIALSDPLDGNWIADASWFLTTACPDAANANGAHCTDQNIGSFPSSITSGAAYFPEPGTYYLHVSGDQFLGAQCTSFDLTITYDTPQCQGGTFIDGNPVNICVGDDGDLQPYYFGRPMAFGSNDSDDNWGQDHTTAADAGFFLYVTPGCTLSPYFTDNSRTNAAPIFPTDSWTLDAQSAVTGTGVTSDPYRVYTVLSGDCDFGGPSLTVTNTTWYRDGDHYFQSTHDICFDNVLDLDTNAPPIAYFAADFWEEAAADDGHGLDDTATTGGVGATHINGDDPDYPAVPPPTYNYPLGNPDTYSNFYQYLIPINPSPATSYQESRYDAIWTAIQNAPTPHPLQNTVHTTLAGCGGPGNDCTDHGGLLQFGTNTVDSDLQFDANGCTQTTILWCFGQSDGPPYLPCTIPTAVTHLTATTPSPATTPPSTIPLTLLLALLTLFTCFTLLPKSRLSP